jgi:hypothetical protein
LKKRGFDRHFAVFYGAKLQNKNTLAPVFRHSATDCAIPATKMQTVAALQEVGCVNSSQPVPQKFENEVRKPSIFVYAHTSNCPDTAVSQGLR